MHDLTRHSSADGPASACSTRLQCAEPLACSQQSISPPIRTISDQGGRRQANTPLRKWREHPARSPIALNSGSQTP
jgi:hypothetical protein